MPKRKALERQMKALIKRHRASMEIRRGGKHDVWKIDDGRFFTTVPRHTEINELTAMSIVKGLTNYLEGR